ncbi:MAG: hypothetical protein KJ928_02595 [Candidatus Altiarchaeota archaeon]|nr:hypothetical protein [Candidatus Altiarchaeota archaeon]
MSLSLPKLEEIGLSRNEAWVYAALLELGETKTGAIVKKTGMHRVQIYDALDALIEKGLATFVIKENRKYFQAMDPDKLLDFLKEKQEIAESLMPELNTIQEKSKVQQQVTIYSGIRGIKTVFDDMLKELSPGGTYYAFSSAKMKGIVGEDYYNDFQKHKREADIKAFLIYYEEFALKKEFRKKVYGSVRFHMMTYFPTDTYIYNDKVLIVIFDANPPFAILIKNKQTAKSYMKLFKALWKNAKQAKD